MYRPYRNQRQAVGLYGFGRIDLLRAVLRYLSAPFALFSACGTMCYLRAPHHFAALRYEREVRIAFLHTRIVSYIE